MYVIPLGCVWMPCVARSSGNCQYIRMHHYLWDGHIETFLHPSNHPKVATLHLPTNTQMELQNNLFRKIIFHSCSELSFQPHTVDLHQPLHAFPSGVMGMAWLGLELLAAPGFRVSPVEWSGVEDVSNISFWHGGEGREGLQSGNETKPVLHSPLPSPTLLPRIDL